MKAVKLSNFLKMDIKPFIAGAFLSRIKTTNIDDQVYFYTYTNFRSSKVVYRDDFDLVNYADVLLEQYNKHSGFYNWIKHNVSCTSMELRFYLLNDLSMSKTMLYKAIYQKLLQCSWILSETMTNEKKDFIRGFVEPRGSIDTTMKLIAQDYFYDNRIELKKGQILTDMMNLPIQYANFNARNLQPQFVSGEKQRNAQFRIDAFYYANQIGFINEYKALVFDKAYYTKGRFVKDGIIFFNVDLPTHRNEDVLFIKYLNFFTNNIYEKNLTKNAVAELRKKIGFSTLTANNNRRNQTIIDIFNEITDDKCAICGTTTTYESKRTGRQFFEVHHMISYQNGQEFDNIANLVKLCPNCHRMMKKGSATKDNQIKAILKILHEHPEIFEFTSSYLGIDDINELSEKIWSMLG